MLFETAWTSVVPRVEVAVLEGHTDLVRSVCSFEAAGRTLLAGGGRDATARIWDPTTGRPVRTLTGHSGEVSAVLFLDGVPVSADDRTVRLRDPGTGRCVLTIPVHHEVLGSAHAGGGLLAVAVPSGVLAYRIRAR
ncbi:hypothetical protein [Streptomyces sp. NPDC088733]|uniref:hypothetical protein n=1 Tax=Streptomyces sp. NPDC088733 TaxID=3365880 RepID=UPI0037F2A98B